MQFRLTRVWLAVLGIHFVVFFALALLVDAHLDKLYVATAGDYVGERPALLHEHVSLARAQLVAVGMVTFFLLLLIAQFQSPLKQAITNERNQ